jgi:hypothetical protein
LKTAPVALNESRRNRAAMRNVRKLIRLNSRLPAVAGVSLALTLQLSDPIRVNQHCYRANSSRLANIFSRGQPQGTDS